MFGGVDGRGAARTGVTFDSPADFASRQYRNRWRRLEIRTDDEARELVGAIEPHPDTGRRIWWAEPLATPLCRQGRCGECPLPRSACACPCHTTGVERQVAAWQQIKDSRDPLPLLVIECGTRAAVALLLATAVPL